MVDTLVAKTCAPCRGGIPPLTPQEAERFHVHVPRWEVREEARRIERTFRFRNFAEAFALVQQVGGSPKLKVTTPISALAGATSRW